MIKNNIYRHNIESPDEEKIYKNVVFDHSSSDLSIILNDESKISIISKLKRHRNSLSEKSVIDNDTIPLYETIVTLHTMIIETQDDDDVKIQLIKNLKKAIESKLFSINIINRIGSNEFYAPLIELYKNSELNGLIQQNLIELFFACVIVDNENRENLLMTFPPNDVFEQYVTIEDEIRRMRIISKLCNTLAKIIAEQYTEMILGETRNILQSIIDGEELPVKNERNINLKQILSKKSRNIALTCINTLQVCVGADLLTHMIREEGLIENILIPFASTSLICHVSGLLSNIFNNIEEEIGVPQESLVFLAQRLCLVLNEIKVLKYYKSSLQYYEKEASLVNVYEPILELILCLIRYYPNFMIDVVVSLFSKDSLFDFFSIDENIQFSIQNMFGEIVDLIYTQKPDIKFNDSVITFMLKHLESDEEDINPYLHFFRCFVSINTKNGEVDAMNALLSPYIDLFHDFIYNSSNENVINDTKSIVSDLGIQFE